MTVRIINKLRKNDYCAVVVTHSETMMHGPTKRYTRIVLAQVAKASRDGLVQRVTFAGCAHSVEAARVGVVHALPDDQVQARRLFVATRVGGGVDYADAAEFKVALESAVDTIIEEPKDYDGMTIEELVQDSESHRL